MTKIESIRFKRYQSFVISAYVYPYISPTAKYGNKKHDKLHRTNRLWKTVENTTRYQSDPIEHVANLSKNTITKATFQL